MIIPKAKDVIHKQQMFRLLRAVLGDKNLRTRLKFKGGSSAALRGLLDRFSVDLDFDLPDKTEIKIIRKSCYQIFDRLGFEIKDENKKHLQFFLRYPIKGEGRNTLKLEINDNPSTKNIYETVQLQEINMLCQAHSIETMVANKMVAAKARFDRNNKIAGRDFYDLHQFLLAGLAVNEQVVEDLTKMSYVAYLKGLVDFIEDKVTDKLLMQDLNPLLPADKLRNIKDLKIELLGLIRDEIERKK